MHSFDVSTAITPTRAAELLGKLGGRYVEKKPKRKTVDFLKCYETVFVDFAEQSAMSAKVTAAVRARDLITDDKLQARANLVSITATHDGIFCAIEYSEPVYADE